MYVRSPTLARDQTLIRRKLVAPAFGGGLRVFAEAKARPFGRLADDDLLDSADVCALFGCSARSLYRWLAEGLLVPSGKVGREYVFTKRAVLKWWDGRPPSQRPPAERG